MTDRAVASHDIHDEPGGGSLDGTVRVALASASAGAGAIHLAMAPSHASEWLAEGVAFALAGWLQLALAVAFLVRPSRRALFTACAANLVFLGSWLWTRTAGPPFGPEAGVAHDAGLVDLTTVGLEIAVVVLAAGALISPAAWKSTSVTWRASLLVLPIGVLALATIAITSPSASGHAHAESAADGGHHHGGSDAEPHDHSTGAEDRDAAQAGGDAHDDDGHGHGEPDTDASPDDDEGLALLSNGEMAHDYGPDEPLDAETRAVLVHQLALTRLVAQMYPTLGDARAAGSQPAGGFGPGMGIHMSFPGTPPTPPPRDPSLVEIPGTLTDEQILRPSNLLYAGSDDAAPLAGFMYYLTTAEEPEGFAGPNDHWHTHGSLCVTMAGGKVSVLHPEEDTRESCEELEGIFVERTDWMVHVWTVPGYESNRGVFSDINPSIACPDGTYHTVTEEETERYKLNKCRSNPE